MIMFRQEMSQAFSSQNFEFSNLMKKIFTPIYPTAKCPHGEKYGEMSHGEKVVRRNVPRRNVLTAKCPYGEMSHGEVSHGEKSHGEMSDHEAGLSCTDVVWD